MLFLSGPMGCGKSTVARKIAERWGKHPVDLDARIATRAGMAIEDIFHHHGEPAFRAMEREEALSVLSERDRAVVALGGGTVTDEQTRRLLLQHGVLVTLTAPVDVLADRVAREKGRPLLKGEDARGVLTRLLRERSAAYAECHGVVSTDGRSPEEVAEVVLGLYANPPVTVPLGSRTYRVEVGSGIRTRLADRVGGRPGSGTVVVVTDSGVQDPWARQVTADLERAGHGVVQVVLEQGERHKGIASVEAIWNAALESDFDRDGIVVAVGGGVVGDLAAFAASTVFRGVEVGQVPTTLLSMVDSSVGGKTGFDRPQGKNLVGTFHQPRFVLCDVETLSTLPSEERVSGLAEVVKSAWLAGEAETSVLERTSDALRAGDADATIAAIRMSVTLKAQIVMADERESGNRRLLNLGHTVGHAIETAQGFVGMRHGEAVALGMVAASRVARAHGQMDREQSVRLERLLAKMGLPTDLDSHLSEQVFDLMSADKKRTGDVIRFIAPGVPGQTTEIPLSVDAIRTAVSAP